ncbi:unnamed protein product [Fusarium graminearum]|nr:unnamed protein product [Fusarium graminearum]
MDTDLKALSAVYAFVLIGSGSALYVEPHKRVGYIPLLTECDGPGSNLTATLGPVNAARVSQFNTRREINEMMWTAVAAAGGTVIMGVCCVDVGGGKRKKARWKQVNSAFYAYLNLMLGQGQGKKPGLVRALESCSKV